MIYYSFYQSIIGKLTIYVANNYLIALEQEQETSSFKDKQKLTYSDNNKIIMLTKEWLDKYFKKDISNLPKLPIKLTSSPFNISVWEVLKTISYQETITYSDIARIIGSNKAYRAVGSAVGKNPISIIIPCHRVIGSNNSLGGYNGGLANKIALLNHEDVDTKSLNK